MECNKEEATRVKIIAEKRLLERDIVGAKRSAKKAHSLYPQLDGISELLATINVYVRSEKKINGEIDWYGILGVDSVDNEDAIRKQYRKLALMFHPDKNKAKGADGAFNLISQAWNVLSDKAKRSAYDKVILRRIQHRDADSSVLSPQNGFFNFANGSKMKAPKDSNNSVPTASHKEKQTTAPPSYYKEKQPNVSSSHKHKTSTPSSNKERLPTSPEVATSSHKQKPPNIPVASQKRKRVPHAPDPHQEPKQQSTFWTACHGCKIQYEYPRIYINRNLLCPNCREPFFSFEIEAPYTKGEVSANHKVRKNNSTPAGPNVKSKSKRPHDNGKFQWTPFSKTAHVASAAAEAANMVQHAYEKVKREREEAEATTRKEEASREKRNASGITGNILSDVNSNASNIRSDTENSSVDGKTMNQYIMGNGSDKLSWIKQFNINQLKVCKITRPCTKKKISDELKQDILIEKARMEILKKSNEGNPAILTKLDAESNLRLLHEAEEKKKQNSDLVVNGAKENGGMFIEPIDDIKEKLVNESITSTSVENFSRLLMSVEVPDSDFYDFDKYRNEKSFKENQVWAAYDNDDGLPRFYAMVQCVICLNPFKIQVSWLYSKTNNNLGSLMWSGSPLSKICGDYKIGKSEICDSINTFSHEVKYTKCLRGGVQIYPKNGDVWALYRNWSLEWNELTPYEVIHQYDIVEVLNDYDEKEGAIVIPLVKVAGYRTVFRQHLDPKEVQRIPTEEMSRFSHYIPSYWITGEESPTAPRGCRELDPAATPSEFLRIIPDVMDGEIEEIFDKEPILDNVEVVTSKKEIESHCSRGENELVDLDE